MLIPQLDEEASETNNYLHQNVALKFYLDGNVELYKKREILNDYEVVKSEDIYNIINRANPGQFIYLWFEEKNNKSRSLLVIRKGNPHCFVAIVPTKYTINKSIDVLGKKVMFNNVYPFDTVFIYLLLKKINVYFHYSTMYNYNDFGMPLCHPKYDQSSLFFFKKSMFFKKRIEMFKKKLNFLFKEF